MRGKFEFIYGVARDSSAAGITGARVNGQVYQLNRTLDTDGDGVACELDVYDSGVTTRSSGFTSMYSACKILRRAEFSMSYILGMDYPYMNERSQLMIWMQSDIEILPLVRSAAKINPIFRSALKAVEQSQKVSTSYWQAWPKEPWTPKPDFSFSNWCGYFGVYESQPGLLPPIKWTEPSKSLTALNGARGVCKRLFWGSPDRVMYSDEDTITLNDCDSEALRISSRSRDYYTAKETMLDYIFDFHEYWCWGKDCVTRFDLDY
jgi:hypothetical protein